MGESGGVRMAFTVVSMLSPPTPDDDDPLARRYSKVTRNAPIGWKTLCDIRRAFKAL